MKPNQFLPKTRNARIMENRKDACCAMAPIEFKQQVSFNCALKMSGTAGEPAESKTG